MENKKGNKKVVIGLVCLAMLVLIGFIVYKHHQIKILSQALNSANESIEKLVSERNDIPQKDAAQDTTLDAKGKGQGDIDDLKYQLEAAEEELDLAYEQLSDALAKNDENTNSMGMSPMADMMKMIADPEKKKELITALKRGFNQQYGTLFKLLNLSPEKLRQFKELLANQTIEMIKINNEVNTIEPTEENRNKLQERLDEFLKQRNADLAALLGSQDYQTYKNYKDSQQERGIVERFAYSLSAEDKLSNEQQEALINSMCQERKNVFSQTDDSGRRIIFPSERSTGFFPSDEDMEEAKETEESIKDTYLKSTGDILSASQGERFKEYFEQPNATMPLPMPPDSTTQDNSEEGQGPSIFFNLY